VNHPESDRKLPEWPVARLGDIAEPGALEFTTGQGDWPYRGLIVHWKGEVHAYANSCPHQGHPLNIEPRGFFSPDQQQLICMSHGAMFEPSSGICTFGPCAGAQLKRLECRVENGMVWVKAPSSLRQSDE
jgi:nitrite reductase/ring-hydroxylating ferredoxin subunit